MSKIEKALAFWPPRGWKQLGGITEFSGQAIAKDIRTARIFGLSYNISSEVLYKGKNPLNRYTISIEGWEYSILNESNEYPVLSFNVLDRNDLLRPKDQFVSDIKVMSRPVTGSQASRRAVTAGLFLIKQIMAGQVPDAERVLRIYRLFPNSSGGRAHKPLSVTRLAKADALSKSWKIL